MPRRSTASTRQHPWVVRTSGEGTPVVLLHDVAGASTWEDVVRLGVPGARLLCVELPGVGSTPAAKRPSFEAWLRGLGRLVAQLPGGSAVLAGPGFGGVLALALAQRAPARVAGLWVGGVPALGLPPGLREMGGELGALPAPLTHVWSLVRRPLVRGVLSWLAGKRGEVVDGRVEGCLRAMDNPGYLPAIGVALQAIGAFRLDPVALRATHFPRRVHWGSADPLVPVLQGEQVAKALDAELEVLYGVGHCLAEEAPDAVARALEAIVAGAGRAKARVQRGRTR